MDDDAVTLGAVVIVDERILDGEPIRAISYLHPEHEWDSGFALFAGEPGEEPEAARGFRRRATPRRSEILAFWRRRASRNLMMSCVGVSGDGLGPRSSRGWMSYRLS
jgi:hypothetical protein